jgi:hypothetical protein
MGQVTARRYNTKKKVIPKNNLMCKPKVEFSKAGKIEMHIRTSRAVHFFKDKKVMGTKNVVRLKK